MNSEFKNVRKKILILLLNWSAAGYNPTPEAANRDMVLNIITFLLITVTIFSVFNHPWLICDPPSFTSM